MRVVLIIAVILAFNLHSYGVSALLGTEDACTPLNTSCEDCIKGAPGVRCYFCQGDCLNIEGLTSDSCSLEDIKLGQCQLTALALIVIVSSGAFLLAVGGCGVVCACLYCYCRFCRKGERVVKTQTRIDAEMSEMQERHAQRRSERTARGDELRRKYGLDDEDDMSKYQRF